MNIYRVTLKRDKNQPFWDDNVLLIEAADFGNAEDKARNFTPVLNAEIDNIKLYGETTAKPGIYILKER